MKYLNKLINFILAPICKEPVFFGVFAFLLFFSHCLSILPDNMSEMSIYNVRNILIIFSGSAFISWCFSALVGRVFKIHLKIPHEIGKFFVRQRQLIFNIQSSEIVV